MSPRPQGGDTSPRLSQAEMTPFTVISLGLLEHLGCCGMLRDAPLHIGMAHCIVMVYGYGSWNHYSGFIVVYINLDFIDFINFIFTFSPKMSAFRIRLDRVSAPVHQLQEVQSHLPLSTWIFRMEPSHVCMAEIFQV